MATTWYARQTANINAANVWNDVADGSGNWLTWPCATDDTLIANGFTITINVNTTCAKVATATNSGTFKLANGVTLTADVEVSWGYAVTFDLSTPDSAAIVGNIYGSAVRFNSRAIQHDGTGSLHVTGNVTGGTQAGAVGAYLNAAGTLTIVGSVTGGSAGHGISTSVAELAWRLEITGNVTGGTGHGVNADGPTGLVEITGDVTGGTGNGAGLRVNRSGQQAIVVGDAIATATSPGLVMVIPGPYCRLEGDIIPHSTGICGAASFALAMKNGAHHYTDYAEADTDPPDYTGELIRHHGTGLLPTPAEVAAAVWTYDGPEGRTLT